MTQSPDELVAARIVAGLLAQQLIAPAQVAGLRHNLAAGLVAAQDWQLLAAMNVADAVVESRDNPWEADEYGHPH